MMFTRACACGVTITADPDDPMPAIREHISTEPHRSWSIATHTPPLPKLTVGPLTVERLGELGLLPKGPYK